MQIAQEISRQKPQERRLRHLYRLLKSYLQAEVQAGTETRTKAIEDANELERQKLELKKQDYRLRFAQSPLGARSLLAESERLRARVTELEVATNEVGVQSEDRGHRA